MAHPFVKWAGGKSQLVERLCRRMPETYGSYFEPFVGGGAMLFALSEANAGRSVFVNDVNPALIGTYRAIQGDVGLLCDLIARFDAEIPEGDDAAKEHYYAKRTQFNEHLSAGDYDVECSALFIWLNKHCFNGLYRVNKKGLFNVPWNRNTKPCLDAANLFAAHDALQGVTVTLGDFAEALNGVKEGDFVFLDSPYVPVKADSFTDYTADGFTYDDHVRLSEVYRALDEHGVLVMETNHNVDLIHELYSGFSIEVVDVRRAINSDASKRTGQEVIITNYEVMRHEDSLC